MKKIKNFNNFRLYEFEENSKIPQAEVASFMDNLYQRIKEELVPIIPSEWLLSGERFFIPTAVIAAVRIDVMALPSIIASGSPVFESFKTTVP